MGRDERFIKELYQVLVNEALKSYVDIYETTPEDEVTDSFYKDAFKLFRSLDKAQKETFYEIHRQVIIDTISDFLGTVTDAGGLPSFDEGFTLSDNDSKKALSPDLQDLFLEYVEELEEAQD